MECRATLAKLSRLSTRRFPAKWKRSSGRALSSTSDRASRVQKAARSPHQFNAEAGRLFAAEIDFDHIRVAVSNLEGAIVEQTARPIGSDCTASHRSGRYLTVLFFLHLYFLPFHQLAPNAARPAHIPVVNSNRKVLRYTNAAASGKAQK